MTHCLDGVSRLSRFMQIMHISVAAIFFDVTRSGKEVA
jgi:hypothetical protein